MKAKKQPTPQEYKSKNIKLFEEIYDKIKGIDFTEESHSSLLRIIILESKSKFKYIDDYNWWQQVIPALVWMKIMDVDVIKDEWFSEDEYNIFDKTFVGAEFVRVFMEAYCMAKNLRSIINDNDFLFDDTGVKFSKNDLQILLS